MESVYASFLAGDVPAIVEKADDGAVWKFDLSVEAAPYAGTYLGKGVADFFPKLAASEATTKFDVGNPNNAQF